jgi:hypothetical protein
MPSFATETGLRRESGEGFDSDFVGVRSPQLTPLQAERSH